MATDNERDYSREDDAAMREVKRRINRQESMAEASEELTKKFAKEVWNNKEVRQQLSKDCLNRYTGRTASEESLIKLTGRDGNRVPSGMINEAPPTGYEKMPWQEDDE